MDAFNVEPIARSESGSHSAGAIKMKTIYTEDELRRSPSIQGGMSFAEEQRKLIAGCTMIRMIAERLNDINKEAVKISQLCVNVAMVHLRRFFTIHPLQQFDARDVGAAILFMTTKSEECPKRLEYVVRAWFRIRYESDTRLTETAVSINRVDYEKYCEYIVWLEHVTLQSIGFSFGVDVPHPIVLQNAQAYRREDKKFAESVFWFTTDALHLTNWSIRFRAQSIACITYWMTTMWRDEQPQLPPPTPEGSAWFTRFDKQMSLSTIQQLAREFLTIWRDIDLNINLSMSCFDYKTQPLILERLQFAV